MHFKRALILHESAQEFIGQADDHFQLGDVLYRSHRMEEAKTCYRSALDLNVQSDNSDGQYLTRLAEICKKLGKLDESREHYERILTFHEERHDQRSLANTLNDLGHVYLMMDNVKRAKESSKRALELHKAVSDPVGQANDLSGLADVHQRLYKRARAEAAHKIADVLRPQQSLATAPGAARYLTPVRRLRVRRVSRAHSDTDLYAGASQ